MPLYSYFAAVFANITGCWTNSKLSINWTLPGQTGDMMHFLYSIIGNICLNEKVTAKRFNITGISQKVSDTSTHKKVILGYKL